VAGWRAGPSHSRDTSVLERIALLTPIVSPLLSTFRDLLLEKIQFLPFSRSSVRSPRIPVSFVCHIVLNYDAVLHSDLLRAPFTNLTRSLLVLISDQFRFRFFFRTGSGTFATLVLKAIRLLRNRLASSHALPLETGVPLGTRVFPGPISLA